MDKREYQKYIDNLFLEKELSGEVYEIESKSSKSGTRQMSQIEGIILLRNVEDPEERSRVRNFLVKADFMNRDFNKILRDFGQAHIDHMDELLEQRVVITPAYQTRGIAR